MGKDARTTGAAARTNGRRGHLDMITWSERPAGGLDVDLSTRRVAVVPLPRPAETPVPAPRTSAAERPSTTRSGRVGATTGTREVGASG